MSDKQKQDELKSTPGPWYIDETGIDIIYISSPNTMESMGTICDLYFKNDHGIHRFDNAEANARLIAAAPETAMERDKLKVINAELLEAIIEAELHSRKRLPVKKATWLKMCAAIAKAKG